MTETPSKAKEILLKYRLCDRCLERLLTAGNHRGRGAQIKARLLEEARATLQASRDEALVLVKALAESGYVPAQAEALELGLQVEATFCPICLGRLTDEVIKTLVAESAKMVNGYEFEDFLVGALIPKHLASIEERIFSEFGLAESETLRKEVTREVGSRLEVVLNRPVNFTSPEMLILVDIFTGTVEARPAPLYVFGHYFKRQPNIPQTPWYCSSCWGAGCEKCGGLGRMYPDSVAEYIGEPSMRLAKAIGYKFHAAGREDVDVTVEEGGRPFIIELVMPRLRRISFDELKEAVRRSSDGRVEVDSLRLAARSDLDLLKESMESAVKRYRAVVRFERPIEGEALKKLEATLRGAVIEQHTPRRVIKRRGDRLRRKRVALITSRLLDDFTVELNIEAEGGLYVKELIHGDEGRTEPNVAEILNNSPLSINLKFLGVSKTIQHVK